TRKLPTPGGRLSCTRENDPVRDSSGKQHTNKCLMCLRGQKWGPVLWGAPPVALSPRQLLSQQLPLFLL
uniref:Kazal-like domain-containing protein n=1 Tax=Calidris pygmaea TaxID=425635 RepID=A0A8C3KHC0_9CHAR